MYSVNVNIRDTLKSEFLENHIIKKAAKLNQFCQQINRCRIVVDMPQKHKHQGKLFRVSIELNVHGMELVVNRKLDEDVYVAVARAFDAIERKLEDYSHRRVNNIRKRKRAANNGVNSAMNAESSNDYFNNKRKMSSDNDDLFLDEIDSDYDDISQIIKDEFYSSTSNW